MAQLPFRHATAWPWFEDAAHLLVGSGDDPGGLRLYLAHPEFQFGPLSVLIALPLVALGPGAAMVVLSSAGIWCATALRDLVERLRPDRDPTASRRATVVGGLLLIAVWSDVAVRTAHIDDGIALTATVGGLAAAARGRNVVAALALGAAAAAKPWALPFVAILLALDDEHRPRLVALALAVAALSWAPFVLAAPETLDAGRFAIANEASSSLRILGVDDATTPSWTRLTQILAGGLAASWLAVRGRWAEVVMTAISIRLLIDPAANRYYTAGLVLGILIHELTARPDRVPWLAAVAALLLEVPQSEGFPPTAAGWLRLAVVVAVLSQAARAAPSPRLGPREAGSSSLSTITHHG